MFKFFLVFLFLFFVSCSDSPEKPSVNPFAGNWRVVFTGTYQGSGTVIIESDGSFSFPVYLTSPYGSFTNTVIGSVSSNGNLKADIYYDADKVGSASGKLSGNRGSGSYITWESSGSWLAEKI